MIYTVDEIKAKVTEIADRYDIEKILLFGSYFDHVPTEHSDVDLLVKYGKNCRGLCRIRFMNDLQRELKKKVDVINIDFKPEFLNTINLECEQRCIYIKKQTRET